MAGLARRGDESGPSISLAELARQNGTAGLGAEGVHRSEHMTYPYGVHIAQVRVDRETGGVTVERFLVAYDIGRAVNPMMIAGQIAGGYAQGLGGALYEEFLYSRRGAAAVVDLCRLPDADRLRSLECGSAADGRRAQPAECFGTERIG